MADLLESLPEKERIILFRLLPALPAADVFAELDKAQQRELLKLMSDQRIKEVISQISPDDRTDLFEDLPGVLAQRILNLLHHDDRREILELLGYPENSIGRLMTPDYAAVKPYWTVRQAVFHIRERGQDVETVDIIYVVDDQWRLVGSIPIRRLILSDYNQKVSGLTSEEIIAVLADNDQEEAVKVMEKYDLPVVPVIDAKGILLGIVTIDDIVDVIEEETTEDFQKSSAVEPLEKSYSESSPWFLYRKRVGWLILLLLADFLSSGIIAHFEKLIQAVLALTLFIPILIDSGGNTATQSATLVIRALSTGELTVKKWFEVIKKELITGGLLGLTLGTLLCLRGFIWRGGPEIGLVVGLAMIVTVIWANLLGSILPIILTKFNLDPAVISSPLLTTLIDSTGLLIYFSIAKIILL